MSPSQPSATLFEAVEQNDLKRLRELIKNGTDINESDEDTPLSMAAELGHTAIVRELLKAGADADVGGLTVPLCAAVRNGSAQNVELLLKAGAKVDAQEEAGESALMLAAASGNLKIVKRLLKAGTDPKLQDEDGETAILYGRRWPKVVALLKPLSPPEDVGFIEKEQAKIAAEVESLLAAVQSGNLEQVQKQLASGVSVDGANQDGETALHMAAKAENLTLVELLLKAGANVNAGTSGGITPLWEAVGKGNFEIMERLIQAGADVNAPSKPHGFTPFLTSIGPRKKERQTMLWLARHGADVRATDNYGRSALSLASHYLCHADSPDETKRKDCAAIEEVFTQLGLLHPQADDFIAAASKGDMTTIDHFLAGGLPPDVVDTQERTALYVAISRQQVAVVRRLLDAKADVHKPIGEDNGEDRRWGGRALACPACGEVFISMLADRTCLMCGKTFNAEETFGFAPGGELFFRWSNGHLPLMVAARVNRPDLISMLVAAGADVDRGKDGITALMVAAYFGHVEAARELLRRGANANRKTKTPDRVRETIFPVLLAARGKHIAIVKLLWDAGVPAENKRSTLLVAAAKQDEVEEIQRLIQAGADPNTPDPLTTDLPLSAAAESGCSAAVEALIQAGASVAPDPRRLEPLHLAVTALEYKKRRGQVSPEVVQRYVAIAKSLLAAGDKATIRTFGMSPLSIAEDMNCPELVKVLKAAASEPPPRRKK